MSAATFRRVEPILRALRLYHRHTVHGLEHVPRRGPALLVINHSLATYDALLLGHAIHEATGRLVRGLADRLMFRIPGVRELATALGIVEGSPESGRALLDAGNLVMVAPGGMRESLRPSSEAFHIDWRGRWGFVRLAAAARVPILLAACPAADEIYSVYDAKLTRWVYERFRVPLPFARGFGLSLLPRPTQLTHRIAPPIAPPRARTEAGLERAHARIVACMETLMREARAKTA